MKFLFSLFISLNIFAAVDPAELLLSSFRSQCPNVVSFSSSATLLLNNYKSVLLELKEREKCYGSTTSLTSLANFEKSYTQFELYRQAKLEKQTKERLVADYTFYLAQNQINLSAEDIAFLKEEIFSNQAAIVAMDSEIVRFESMGQGFEQGSQAFLNSFNELLSSVDGSNQCLSKTDSLYGTLLGNGLSIASLFTSPASSLYLSMSGSVVKSVSNYINDAKYTSLLNEADSILWPEAIRCVSEAMTKNYCGALQTQNLFNDYVSDENDEDRVIFEGVDLLNYYIKGLDEWLIQVFAGSPITSQGDLTDREKPILQAELLGRIVRYMQGYKTIKDGELDTLNEPNLTSNAVYGSIVGLSYIMKNPSTLNPTTSEGGCYSSDCHSDVQNPIFTARTQTDLLFQLYGFNEIPSECTVDGVQTACPSLKTYLDQKGIKLNRQNWQTAYANAQTIVAATLDQVNVLRARTVSFDPVGLFVLANRNFSNKPNALQGLDAIYDNGQRVISYLKEIACEDEPEFCEDNAPTWMNSYSLQIEDVQETIKLTEMVIGLVKEASNPRPISSVDLPEKCNKSRDQDIFIVIDSARKEKAFVLSTCITDILELAERGNDIYFSKIRSMVSMELEAKLKRGELSSRVEDVLRATRDDLIERLTTGLSQSSNVSIGQVLTGLDSSKDITRKTMSSLRDVFEKQIIKSVNDKNNSSRVKTELCFRVLPLVDRSKESNKFLHEIYDTCKSEVLTEVKGTNKLVWSDFVKRGKKFLKAYEYKLTKSQDEMICALDYFFIENKLSRERKKQQRRHRKELIENAKIY
ncbi:hypothetical protein [Bacteriovorax sp. Seq25_V]|uniref:hypothetical protein n=1 Tax=Bacteriovorax sp. Seq25_V TaxID=1201288 RepID=UPI00038A1A41|nr:hypothetical protein [Bacteriovorax sp. Seq25_V]EQC46538.1 hypothetical protein M900_2348 [Bacteriovorax sp. Seq25_V]